jgi:hypothetical protein
VANANIAAGVRVIYAVVVIIKLYIAANSPGEIASVIKKEDLNVEQYLDRLQRVFKRMMDQDGLSPHVKFLWVIERLQERWQGIKNGKSNICRSGGKSTPLSESRVPSSSTAGTRAEEKGIQDLPAQGLHLLSEAAMSGNHDPSLHHHQQQQAIDPSLQQPQPQPQDWQYAQQPAMDLPMDPNAYLYTGGPLGYDGFDYGIGMLGSSMDGAISGLFMPDAMLGFAPQVMDPSQGQGGGGGGYPPW